MRIGAQGRPALAAMVLFAIAFGAIGAAPPGARAATPDVTLIGRATYDVRPDEHRVAVSVAITATNRLHDTITRQYTIDRAYLVVPPAATNLHLAAPTGTPSVTVTSRTAANQIVLLRFGSRLAAGRSMGLTLTFDLADPGGAPDRALRVSPSLVRFSAWGLGTDGVSGSSVTVQFPVGYVAEIGRGPLSGPTTTPDGHVRYASAVLSTPGTFVADLAADRPGALVSEKQSIVVGARTVTIDVLAWPDDPEWRARVTDLLVRGLPAMRAAIGVDWPIDPTFEVRESISASGTGAGDGAGSGTFSASGARLNVLYTADPGTILRGEAHAWFNASLVADRWIADGFASLYAERVGAILNVPVTSAMLSERVVALAQPLNGWVAGTGADAFGYGASLQLARSIADRAGDGVLATVWRDALDRTAAYQPTVAPGGGAVTSAEHSSGPVDWRSFLDLLEERSGTSFESLWRAWVVRPSDAVLLDGRAATRTLYASTMAAAEPWVLPRTIRDAMRAWQFEDATTMLQQAVGLVGQRSSLASAADAAGLQLPGVLRQAFEGTGGLTAASAEAVTEQAVIAAYASAAAAEPRNPDLFTRMGLIGKDPQAELAAARAAFAAGDLDGTARRADAAHQVWSQAADVGRGRIISGAMMALALLALWWLLSSRRRASRRRHARRKIAAPPG